MKSSKGEVKIAKLLSDNKISYKKEVSFPNLTGKGGRLLRYDFGIYYGDKLTCLIEYDGEGHFKYISHFEKNESEFECRKGCDRKKNQYALRHGILLIRIPYWEYDNITLEKMFNTPDFVVKNVFHNDILIRGVK